jgi:hypothetical protein
MKPSKPTLTELRIANFKAFGSQQTIPIRPLTLIFGANSSGKSSVIHSLLLANHAHETGNWNVREPRLGAGSVDLGGFPQFIYRHQREARLSLHFEYKLTEHVLRDFLFGTEPEMAPFFRISRSGVSLGVGRSDGGETSGSSEAALAIQSIDVGLEGKRALRFARRSADSFQCIGVESDHPLIRQLLRDMLGFAHTRPRETAEDLDSSLFERLSHLHEPVRERVRNDVFDPEKYKQLEERRAQREALNERFARLAEPQFLEEEAQALGGILAEVLAERTFKFDRYCLIDEGPDNRWDWAGWRDELAENGVLSFFRDRADDIANECGDIVYGQRWAEAQAIRFNLTQLIAGLTASTSVDLIGLAYLGPLRVVPPRHLLASTDDFSDSSGGGLDAWHRLCKDVLALEAVNRWFAPDWLRLPFRLSVRQLVYADEPSVGARLPELVFEDAGTQSRLSHRDLGFGVTQVLPVLVNAAAQRHSMIAIEQPELHLHPAQQSELGDVFIESALGDRQNTFLLETHSEHLVLRILRRVRETTENKLPEGKTPVRPEDVAVLYVQVGANGAEVIELPVTPDGDFGRPWPGGFFAERFQELP